jgi:hypothetical protein
MALKMQQFYAPFTAKWGSQTYFEYGLRWRDSLEVSVDSNPGGENPFWASHITVDGSIGSPKNPRVDYWDKQFEIPGPSSFGDDAHWAYAPDPSWDAANLWARTNPSRPSVLLPVFWLELRDIPDMIRQAGRFLLHAKRWRQYIRTDHQTRDLATANLAFQFGWAPLLGDLLKLADFQSSVDKRLKEIRNATKHGGYRRRIPLDGTQSKTLRSGYHANFGNYRNFYLEYEVTSSTKCWAVMKWKPTSGDVLPSRDGDIRPYVLGIHPSNVLSNVWEALPWSWLIDYFANIGDVLDAGNHHLATPNGGSVMFTRTTVAKHDRQEQGLDELSAGTARKVEHFPSPVSTAALTARIPSLGAGQLSILGSLSVLKGRRILGS